MRYLVLAFAVLMLVAGVLWAGAGMGWWGDRSEQSWATLGSLVAGLGVALGIVVLQNWKRS